MIFVCVGTQRYQFNRLFLELDRLVDEGILNEEIIAQTGHSTYLPKNFSSFKFLNPDEFDLFIKKADLIISHGGAGTLIKSLKAEKQIIGVPRLEKYKEHSDDHQLQIINMFESKGYIKKVVDIEGLESAISLLWKKPISRKYESEGTIHDIIRKFIISNNY